MIIRFAPARLRLAGVPRLAALPALSTLPRLCASQLHIAPAEQRLAQQR
jgi:hypothetical protein